MLLLFIVSRAVPPLFPLTNSRTHLPLPPSGQRLAAKGMTEDKLGSTNAEAVALEIKQMFAQQEQRKLIAQRKKREYSRRDADKQAKERADMIEENRREREWQEGVEDRVGNWNSFIDKKKKKKKGKKKAGGAASVFTSSSSSFSSSGASAGAGDFGSGSGSGSVLGKRKAEEIDFLKLSQESYKKSWK